MDPIIGGILGGAARLVPEFLKAWDRKNERKHELALGQHELEVLKLQGNTKLEGDRIQADASTLVAGLEAMRDISKPSGVKWIDGLNAMVRPWITAVLFHAWAAVKVAAFVQLSNAGISWDTAAITMWTPDDGAMLSGVMAFWFLGRVFEKKR
jgi:hypothetical protein